jgi:hypothetical protein
MPPLSVSLSVTPPTPPVPLLTTTSQQNVQKKQITAALNVLANKTLYFDWTTQWVSVHDGNTSQLGGLKPGCRQDSANPKLYWVGIFTVSNKRIVPPPLIQASFATVPNTATAIAELRKALAVGRSPSSMINCTSTVDLW